MNEIKNPIDEDNCTPKSQSIEKKNCKSEELERLKDNLKKVSYIEINVNKNDSLDSIDEKFFMSELKKNVEQEEYQCENAINYNIEDEFELEQSAIKKKKNEYVDKIKSNIKGFSKRLDNDTTYFDNNDFQTNEDESKFNF